jgi:hypothetical protein
MHLKQLRDKFVHRSPGVRPCNAVVDFLWIPKYEGTLRRCGKAHPLFLTEKHRASDTPMTCAATSLANVLQPFVLSVRFFVVMGVNWDTFRGQRHAFWCLLI